MRSEFWTKPVTTSLSKLENPIDNEYPNSMKNDPDDEFLATVAWMISVNRCLISLIAHNGQYFNLG